MPVVNRHLTFRQPFRIATQIFNLAAVDDG